MKEKFYDYELLHKFKIEKKIVKIILGTFSKLFLNIIKICRFKKNILKMFPFFVFMNSDSNCLHVMIFFRIITFPSFFSHLFWTLMTLKLFLKSVIFANFQNIFWKYYENYFLHFSTQTAIILYMWCIFHNYSFSL